MYINIQKKDDLLSRFSGVKRSNENKYQAKCPCHNDNHASLTITFDNDIALIHCHANCAFNEIYSRLNLSDFKPEKVNPPKDEVYPYFDLDGNYIFEVVRKPNKRFVQRVVKNGIYQGTPSKLGVKYECYNLKAISKSADHNETIFIVEGEKDVETLKSLGLYATCSPMGAGKWRKNYQKYNWGDVIILPDNDDAGKSHANDVYNSLIGYSRSVKIIELPQLKEKEDVTDWFVKYKNSIENLKGIIEQSDNIETIKDIPEQPEESEIKLDSSFFNALPDVLQNGCKELEDYSDKVVFLLGALTFISGVMPNVFMIYDGQQVGANLYTYILGKAGAGKGALKYAYFLIKSIQEQYDEAYKKKLDKYKLDLSDFKELKGKAKKGEILAMKEPIPPTRKTLLVPINTSTSGFMQLISESDDRGIMFTTEGDTLANTFKSDFGNYSDMLRCSFHHEEVSMYRKTDREYIRSTLSLSVLLSSTAEQLTTLIPSSENGLFSRFMFFEIEPKLGFKNVKDKNKRHHKTYFEGLGDEIHELYSLLLTQNEARIEIINTDEQDEKFLSVFSSWKTEMIEHISDDLEGSIHRLGLIFHRLMMILTILRIRETGDISSKVYVADEDFELALTLVEILNQSAIKVYRRLHSSDGLKALTQDKKKQKAIELNRQGKSYREIKELLAVRSPSTIGNWIKAHRNEK